MGQTDSASAFDPTGNPAQLLHKQEGDRLLTRTIAAAFVVPGGNVEDFKFLTAPAGENLCNEEHPSRIR